MSCSLRNAAADCSPRRVGMGSPGSLSPSERLDGGVGGVVDDNRAQPYPRVRISLRPGINGAADEVVLADLLRADEHRHPRAWRQPEVRFLVGFRQRVAVSRQHPELQAFGFHIEEGVRADVADLPHLRLRARHLDRRVLLTVDRLRLRVAILRARQVDVLEHENAFLRTVEPRIPVVDEAVDHEHAGQAAQHLTLGLAMGVRVVPEGALIVILGDLPPVLVDIVVAHLHAWVLMHERRVFNHLE